MIEVEMPDGTVVEFPEGTDDATIKRVLSGQSAAPSMPPKKKPRERGWGEELAGLAMLANPLTAAVSPDATGLAAQFQQGATLGWADELNAAKAALTQRQGVGNLVSGQSPYEASLAAQAKEREQYQQQYPGRAGTAELAGGLLGAGKLGAGVKAGRGFLAALPRLAGVGAGTGAIAGAGTATPGERAQGGLAGGAIGALLGPAFAGGGKLAGEAFRLGRNALFPRAGAADDAVLAAMGRDAQTPAELAQALRTAPAGVPLSVADVAKQNVQGTLSGAATVPGKAQRIVVDQMESRLADQGTRVREAVSTAAGPRKYAVDLAQEIKNGRWQKAAPLYQEAFKAGRVRSVRVGEILKDPDVAGAYATAQKIAQREGVSLAPLENPDLRTLDYVKRSLDGTITAGFRSENPANAASLKKLRNELVTIMDAHSPAYKAARKVYAGDSEVLDAIEQGGKALNMSEGQLNMALRTMGFAEKEAFRKAALDSLSDKLNTKEGASLLSELLGSEKKRRTLKLIVGEKNYPALSERLMAERTIRETGRRINPTVGSQTAIRHGDVGALPETAQAIGNLASGNLAATTLQALRALQMRGSGLSDEARGRMAQDLMNPDRAAQTAYLQRLQRVAVENARKQEEARRRLMRNSGIGGALPGLLGE